MTEKNNPWDIFKNGADGSASHLKRSGGILMPVFSLPSPHGIGTLERRHTSLQIFLQLRDKAIGRFCRLIRRASEILPINASLPLRAIRILLTLTCWLMTDC